jgi:hypothetical protein
MRQLYSKIDNVTSHFRAAVEWNWRKSGDGAGLVACTARQVLNEVQPAVYEVLRGAHESLDEKRLWTKTS